jgi:hypothetical protein
MNAHPLPHLTRDIFTGRPADDLLDVEIRPGGLLAVQQSCRKEYFDGTRNICHHCVCAHIFSFLNKAVYDK